MNAAASITTDDGDKVNHGWSQLDIAKHSTNTFVSSLGDDDYVSIVTYSDGANVRPPLRRRAPRQLPSPSRSRVGGAAAVAIIIFAGARALDQVYGGRA